MTVSKQYQLECEIRQLKEEREILRNAGAFYLNETTNLRIQIEKIKQWRINFFDGMASVDDKFDIIMDSKLQTLLGIDRSVKNGA